MKDFLKVGLVAFLALGLGTAAHAATINVTTVVDEADGSCADGDCSLRDAVSSALPGDTVSVPAGTYALTLGPIPIDQSLTLTGAAARSTICRARSLRSSRNRSTARGVKPREMILRSRVCCGASMLSSTNLPVSRCCWTVPSL